MNDFPPLSPSDAVAIGRIVQAARDQAPVWRRVEHATVTATARMIQRSPVDRYELPPAEDVRGAYLWITLDTGSEQWWPLSDLVPELIETAFAIHQRQPAYNEPEGSEEDLTVSDVASSTWPPDTRFRPVTIPPGQPGATP